jgi:hypothetical protein
MAGAYFSFDGLEELSEGFKRIGGVPQKYVTAASKKAMTPTLKSAKAEAPVDSGALQKGIILKGERNRVKSKKVYQIVFDRNMNSVFQKPIKNPGIRGGKKKSTGYYPISQEYGYFAGNGNYIPGQRFIRDAFLVHVPSIERSIIDTMKTKIEQQLAKEGL